MDQSPTLSQESSKAPSAEQPTVRKWLWIVLIVLAIALIAVWLFTRNKGSDAVTLNVTNTPTAKSSLSPSPKLSVSPGNQVTWRDITAEWKNYSNTDYGVTFKFPNTWNDPKIEESKKTSDDIPWIAGDTLNIDFHNQSDQKYYIQSVEVSTLDDYKNSSASAYRTSYDKIMNVYNNKNAQGADKLIMPQPNALVSTSNQPTYIENADGSYRGVYYFANIGQDVSTMLNLVAVLTNGTKVFQLQLAMLSDKSAQYEPTLATDSSFKTYVQNLDSSSQETIIKEFDSIYKYIILSLS